MPEIVAARSLCETCVELKYRAPRHRRDDFHAVRDLRLGPLAVEEAGEREARHVGVARRRRRPHRSRVVAEHSTHWLIYARVETDLNRRLHFISGQDPQLDARLREKL